MIVISDANIFIDLYNLDMLHSLMNMDFQVATTDLVYRELLPDQQEVISKLDIIIIDFEDNLGELYEAYADCSTISLSIEDYSLFFVAKANDYILMSNDKRLRNYAKSKQVEVVGILYIFDTLKRSQELSNKELLKQLEKLKVSNKRLEKLITQWVKDHF